MHAAVSHEAGPSLAWSELAPLPIRPDEVRVAVRAASVNPVDWKICDRGVLRAAQRIAGPPGPLVPGTDFAGEVVEVGGAVRGIERGRLVAGGAYFARRQRGSHATEVIARADQVVPVPDGVRLAHAGALPASGVAAWVAVRRCVAAAPAGEPAELLVLGASGGVGHLAVQVGRHLGARVVGVCSSRNADFVASLGGEPVAYDRVDLARQGMGHRRFHGVIDCVGSATYAAGWCRALLRPGGRHVLVVPGAADLPWMLTGSTSAILEPVSGAGVAPVMELLAAGRLQVALQETFDLPDAPRAHALSRSGRVRGKVVLIA